MRPLPAFFNLNQTIVLFVYGQVFFVLGLAIVWQSRKRSRLDLARSLGWLGAFGLAHGLHEWGDIFIPIQAAYLSQSWIDLLVMTQVILLAFSFVCLFQFGASMLSSFDSRRRWLQAVPWGLLIAWMGAFLWASQVPRWTPERLVVDANVWARYLLGLPGALLAAVALWHQTRQRIQVPGYRRITRSFGVASLALVVYAFLAGILGPWAPFFPANTLNSAMVFDFLGMPVELLRSLVGLALVISMVRGLEIFEAETDRRLEEMERAQRLTAERERISRELHDGAIQTVYTAGLLAESIRKRMPADDPLVGRMDRVIAALQHAVRDLRQFIAQLEPQSQGMDLIDGLRQVAADPYLQSLTDVSMALHCKEAESFSAARAAHVLAIVNEALSNVARHAQAHHTWIVADREDGHLMVTVADDGIGFALGTHATGFGLRNMRDRARLLGGSLSIEPRAPRGTVVVVKVPWEDAA